MTGNTVWVAIAVAVAVVLGIKFAGHYVPQKWVSSRCVAPVVSLVSVALLAGLAAQQTFDGGGHLVIDARLAAIAVAAIALWRKVPFIVVILLAAATAALLRHFGF